MSDIPTIDPPPPSSPPSTMSNGNGPAGGANLRGRWVPAKSNLRPYHWLKLTRASRLHDQSSSGRSPEEGIDYSDLERLFPIASPTKRAIRQGKNIERVQLIDTRRAYNCEIMLSKVGVPLPELVNLALVMDDSRLDLDQVDNLIKFCPTKEEMELLKRYTGDANGLGKCEQFFLEVMKVPRLEAKLRVFSYKTKFTAIAFELRNSLTIVNSAADEIRHSAKLKTVLTTIFSLENALNHGTARGCAIGFRLDSLHKLTSTRAQNGKITLMHYLCKVIAEKLPEAISFPKDLISLEEAAKINLQGLADDMQAFTEGMARATKECSDSHNDGTVSVEFCKVSQVFLGYAEPEVKYLTSLYSVVGGKAKALSLYLGEDPTRWPFKKVLSALLDFARAFTRAHEENVKQIELDKRKADLSQMMIENNKMQCTESPSADGQ